MSDQSSVSSADESDTDTAFEFPADTDDSVSIREKVYRAALVICSLLIVVAVMQLYLSMQAVIETFITMRYQPLFRAVFNLIVLVSASYGVWWLVDEVGD